MKPLSKYAMQLGVVLGVLISLAATVALVGAERGLLREEVVFRSDLVRRLELLREIDDIEARRAERVGIAATKPSGRTLRILAERHQSGDGFMRNQIESIIGQMDFADEPRRAFETASATTDIDLFVATAFALGHSSATEARALAFDLLGVNQFPLASEGRRAADTAVEYVLLERLAPEDLAWLRAKHDAIPLGGSQRRFAVRAAEKLSTPKAVELLRRLALDADGEERTELLNRIEKIERAGRRNFD